MRAFYAKSRLTCSQRGVNRRGAAAVEFAIVAVPLFLLILTCFEFCRGMMVVSTMDEAVRAGCRVAILRGSTLTAVEQEVGNFLGISGVDSYSVSVSPGVSDDAEEWDPVTVTISATLSDMSWIPLPNFLSGRVYSATCTMSKEGGSS